MLGVERPVWWDFKNPDYPRIFQERIDRLQRIRQQPGSVPLLKAYYRDHPAQFIMDWGVTNDPRNLEVGKPAIMPFILFDRQIEFVDFIVNQCWRQSEDGLCDKSRDVGASWLTIATACTLCLHYENMSIGFGSRKQEYVDDLNDPKALFFKAREFMRFLPPEFRGGWIEKDAPFMRISFRETSSVMTGEAGDGIGRGGRTAIYFVDEAAHIERPQLVDFSLSATTNCRIDLSSVKGMANSFAIKRHSGKTKVFTFHWRSDPRKDEAWYAKQKARLPAIVVAQEIDIDYSASVEGQVIPSAWVQSAIDAHKKLEFPITGARRAGYDVADEGLDTNAVAGRHGVLLERIEDWSGTGSDLFKSTARAFRLCDEWGYPGFDYDADGLGSGVKGNANVLNGQRGAGVAKLKVNPWRGSWEVRDPEREVEGVPGRKNADFFANRKAQEWWALRMRFQRIHQWVTEGVPCDPAEGIALLSTLPDLSRLQVELSQPTFSTNGAGQIIIDKKPDGAKSPNLADAVMIAYAKGKAAGFNINRGLLK